MYVRPLNLPPIHQDFKVTKELLDELMTETIMPQVKPTSAKAPKYVRRVSIAVCQDDNDNYFAEVNYSEFHDKEDNPRDVVTFWTMTFSSPQEAVQSAWNLYNARTTR